MGCTDILGISEIRTGAKMIYIGVGPDPLKSPGKGVGHRMELDYPEGNAQPEAHAPHTFPGSWSFE